MALLAGIVAVLALGIGCGSDETARTVTVAAGANTTPPSPAPPPPPVTDEKPDAGYTSNCDYLLGDFTTGPQGFRFVADATVTNTGNVGIVAELRASWKQAGSPRIRKTRQARIPYGGVRDIGITVRVTRDQIDQIQAASGDDCSATVAVVRTFGATH